MKRLPSWGIPFVFITLTAVFFYQSIFYRKLPVPTDTLVGLYHPWRDLYAATNPRGVPFRNFLITDPVRQQIPWRKIVMDSWKKGAAPTLNPYTFIGVPLDANVQAAPFYPLNVLFFLFDFSSAWTLLIMLQPLLAGIFMYAYLRRLRLSSVSAIVGGISWAYSGFSISWLTWGTIMQAALWLPLLLLSFDELILMHKKVSHYLKWSACLGFGMMMAVFAGHIQVAVYTIVLSVLYFSYRVTKPATWKAIGWVTIAITFAAVMTSLQWIPLLRFIAESGRISALDTWKNAGWFLPWQHLVQFIVPDFFGNPATLNYWGEWNYGEFIGYIGVIPFVFACSAVFLSGVPRFYAFAMCISLALMLPNPLSVLPYSLHIPVLGVLQPTRLMVLVDFSLAMLAAFGFEQYIKGNRKQLYMSAFVFGIGLICLWVLVFSGRFFIDTPQIFEHLVVAKRNLMLPTLLFGGLLIWITGVQFVRSERVKTAGFGILVLVIIVDLFRFGWKYTPFTSKDYFFPKTSIIRYLEQQPKPFRVMSLDDRILPPNVSSYYGIESIEGYDPIAPMAYENFLGASERGNVIVGQASGFHRIYTAHNIDSPILPYLNVKYVLSLSDLKRPFLREVMQEGETRMYEYTNTLPRVYLSDITQRAYSYDDELKALFAHSPRGIGVSDGSVNVMNIPLSGDEAVSIYAYSTDTMKLKVDAVNERLLIVLNRYDRRWHAMIDGKSQARIVRANYLFMGIVVPPGTHDIILSYR